jgi:Sec-independent protein translocase protein TatA
MGRAESFVLIAVIGMVAFGYKRIPNSLKDLRKTRQILKAEARALRENVPVPPKRTIVAEPGDVTVITTKKN